VSSGLAKKLGIDKKLYPVENTRGGISKKSMIHNGATPKIEVDPETYEVRADGEFADLRAGRGAAHGAALFHVLSLLPGTQSLNKDREDFVIYVVATLTVKPETRRRIHCGCDRLHQGNPQGGRQYRPMTCMKGVTDPSKMVFVEQWENAEALVPHRAAEHMKTFGRSSP